MERLEILYRAQDKGPIMVYNDMKVDKDRWKKSLYKAQGFYFRTSFVGYLQRWRFLYREMKRKRLNDRKICCGSRKDFGDWAEHLRGMRLKSLAIERYSENLVRKKFMSWSNMIKFSQQGLDFRKARGIYRKKVLKKFFVYMKQGNSFDNLPLSKTCYDLPKKVMKRSFGFSYNEDFGREDLNKGEKWVNRFWHKNSVPWFFKAWNKLLHKRLKEKNLSVAVIKARNKQKSRIFFYEWVRKYNISSSKRKKTQQKVHVFQLKWAKYKLVKICKLWVKLYKSKNYYRKLKKISLRRHITKTYHRCFLGFFILYEKGKINKLKHYKALKVKDKTLLLKSIHGWVRYFNETIRKKVAFGKAIKLWSMKIYRKIWMALHDKVARKKYRKNKENDAWKERVADLTQEGVRMFMKYGLQEKSKRDDYIRALIVNETLRTEKLVKKYADKWLSFIRNKVKQRQKTNAEPSSYYGSNMDFPYRKPPRRHIFL